MQSAYFISLFETYFSYDVFSKKKEEVFLLRQLRRGGTERVNLKTFFTLCSYESKCL